jgi:hypothetical protein
VLPDETVIEYDYDSAGNIEARRVLADVDGDGEPNATDCAPEDATVYPGAPEINDGLDNQCPGDAGYGLVDELTGKIWFDDKTTLSWDPQAGAILYQVARSGSPLFPAGCQMSYVDQPTVSVTAEPTPGGAYDYMVRGYLPNAGSWGADSSGVERNNVCP